MELFHIIFFVSSCTLLVDAIGLNGCDLDVYGTCFIIEHQELPWNDARTKCKDCGGDLAILEKINVQSAVNIIARRGVSLWIGLHDLAIDGQPLWVDPDMRYDSNKAYPWAATDDNTPDKDCVIAIGNQGGVLEWRYDNCESPHPFLCEIIGSDNQADMEKIVKDKMKSEVDRLAELQTPSAKIAILNQHLDLFEGDIKLNEDQMLRRDAGLPLIEKRGADTRSTYYWPDRTVHYVFDTTWPLSNAQQKVVRGALQALGNMTCITFVEGLATDYISIINANGCWSYIGRQRGKQQLSLQHNSRGSCIWQGIIQHEFMHALSFYHEQSRYDRDNFVTINWANIITGFGSNFNKRSMTVQNTAYDFVSLMHYGLYDFAVDRSIRTIIPIVDTTGLKVGQRDGPSTTDIVEINELYGCPVINGNWSPWSALADCSVTCGGSTQTRTRTCNNPAPSTNPEGASCVGVDTEVRTCMVISCPLDIEYEHRGCWSDISLPSLLPSLENTNNPYLDGEYTTRNDKGGKCARAAVHVQYKYFALRFDGKCLATSDTHQYQSQGASTECVSGLGTTNSIDVYVIKEWLCTDGSHPTGFCSLPTSVSPYRVSICVEDCQTVGGTTTSPVSVCCSSKQCRDYCGSFIAERDCWCDTLCIAFSDCCPEYTGHCTEVPCAVGSMYDACGPTCPPTCEHPNPVGACTEQCIEGCFCEPGKVIDQSGQCIDHSLCGCYHMGVLYRFGEVQSKKKKVPTATLR